MIRMTTRTKDAGKEPEENAVPEAAETSVPMPDNGPLWEDVSESGRVRVTLWSHPQNAGRPRYTVGIFRRYYSEREERKVNSFYYDERDLSDVIAFAQEAQKKLARLTGEPIAD
jgi:hypothetical protein